MGNGQSRRGIRRLLPSAITILVAGVVACGDGPTTPSGPAGQYALTHAAGQPLPGTVFDGTIDDPSGVTPSFRLRMVATSGALTLTVDGAYQHAVDLTATIDGAPQPAIHCQLAELLARSASTRQSQNQSSPWCQCRRRCLTRNEPTTMRTRLCM